MPKSKKDAVFAWIKFYVPLITLNVITIFIIEWINFEYISKDISTLSLSKEYLMNIVGILYELIGFGLLIYGTHTMNENYKIQIKQIIHERAVKYGISMVVLGLVIQLINYSTY